MPNARAELRQVIESKRKLNSEDELMARRYGLGAWYLEGITGIYRKSKLRIK